MTLPAFFRDFFDASGLVSHRAISLRSEDRQAIPGTAPDTVAFQYLLGGQIGEIAGSGRVRGIDQGAVFGAPHALFVISLQQCQYQLALAGIQRRTRVLQPQSLGTLDALVISSITSASPSSTAHHIDLPSHYRFLRRSKRLPLSHTARGPGSLPAPLAQLVPRGLNRRCANPFRFPPRPPPFIRRAKHWEAGAGPLA